MSTAIATRTMVQTVKFLRRIISYFIQVQLHQRQVKLINVYLSDYYLHIHQMPRNMMGGAVFRPLGIGISKYFEHIYYNINIVC